LDFPSEIGTPILAAAGGMVVVSEKHPAYGNMIEIDHGNQLITRYAHASKLLVKVGTMVKRGQKIAEVGTTGRSTGPHLHFEVLLAGVQQNPARFLAGKVAAPPTTMADASAARSKARASPRRRAPAGGEPPPAWSTPAPSSDLAAVGREAQAPALASDLPAAGSVTPAPAPATPAASPSPSGTESGEPTP
jgi:pyruvate/2-oxoglutarate dehydrogenase complex dihydrolipoamide acyltransferase (E2) component